MAFENKGKAKDPEDYAVNNPNKKIGILLGAKLAMSYGTLRRMKRKEAF
jgi:hypothetical protein